MLKKLKFLFLALLTVFLVLVGHKYRITPTQIIPYPYLIELKNIEDSLEAANANVLIVGDRMARALDKYLPGIIQETGKTLKEPLKIVNWSRANEGLHRTMAKIKALKALPPLIIYHGASEEFYEKKFLISEKNVILDNFKRYDDETILTLIMTVPVLSKYLYTPVHYIRLGDYPKQDTSVYNGKQKQERLEIGFKIFQKEIKEMIQYVKSKDSTLILMTTPINMETEPRSVCDNAKTQTMDGYQDEIEKMIEQGNKKNAYLKASELARISLSNARTHYLKGTAALSLGRFKEARDELELASVHDCTQWRGNVIFNKIMVDVAKENNVLLIDFNNMVNQNLGRDNLFLDSIYPQVVYYQRMISILKKLIKKSFDL